jgi:hypothetical protein
MIENIFLKDLVENPEGKRPLGRPPRRCKDDIKMDLKRNIMGPCGMDLRSSH